MTAQPPAVPPPDQPFSSAAGKPAAGRDDHGQGAGYPEPDTLPGLPAAAAPATGPGRLTVPAPAVSFPGRPRRGWRMVIAAVTGLACLGVAIMAWSAAQAELTRPPTAAELAAAGRAAVAARWRTWRTGRIFPQTLGYTTDLLTQEKADREGIAAGHGCPAALAGAAVVAARQDGCLAALRATYAGQLQGIVYTVGVLAFPGQARAAAFARTAAHDPLPSGLRAFALGGTASALFTDAGRQAAAVRQEGPYVALTVAGYADGRPAGVGERRASVFAPSGQLAGDLLRPLATLPVVRCGTAGWSC